MNHSTAPSESTPVDAGDSTPALEEVFAQYQSELLGMLFYTVGNVEDARDALQESFLRCWRRRGELREVENLKAWIFRVALHTAREVRSSLRRRRRHTPDGNARTSKSAEAGRREYAAGDEELQQLRGAMAELPAQEQEVFLLRQNGELTYEQIGKFLGLPEGTVKTRMRLAIRKLRKAVAGV